MGFMKSKELIKEVLDEYQSLQVNIASEMARDAIANDIYERLSKHYHIFKKNESIVDDAGVDTRTGKFTG